MKLSVGFLFLIANGLFLWGNEEWINGETTTFERIAIETTEDIMSQQSLLENINHASKPIHSNLGRIIDFKGLPQQENLVNTEEIKISIQDENILAIDPNFTAVTFAESGFVPPDSMGAVGPTQYIALVNGRIKSFNKSTGLPDGVLNASTNAFFAPVLIPGTTAGDPRIRYDQRSGRWFAVMLGFGQFGISDNKILIAVSTTSTICQSTSWMFYSFHPKVAQPVSTIANYYADFPTLGIDAFALYVGINVFGNQGGYVTSDGFVINKNSLISGGPMIVTTFRNLVNPFTFSGPYSPQGVDVFDANATEGYFLGVDGQFFGMLQLRRVLNPGGVPQISGNIPIRIPATANPLSVPHRGNNAGPAGNLDAIDTRLGNAHVRDGLLYTVHNVGVNNRGISLSPITRDGCRWYEILLSTTPPFLRQTGTLYQPSATNDLNQRYYWMPSIMTNGVHTIVVGSSVAGANEFANAAYAMHFASDVPGTLRTPVLYTNSQTAYNLNSGSPRRWGDYSNTSIDPSDNMTIWTMQEFCNATNSWGVRAINILAPPPPPVLATNITQIQNGLDAINITLFADTLSEGAFYAGDDLSNKLTISFTGNVEVISTDYVSEKEIQLTISTLEAKNGFVNAIVTNPDGQWVSGSNLFEIMGNARESVIIDETKRE
jgi:hypothetical protein